VVRLLMVGSFVVPEFVFAEPGMFLITTIGGLLFEFPASNQYRNSVNANIHGNFTSVVYCPFSLVFHISARMDESNTPDNAAQTFDQFEFHYVPEYGSSPLGSNFRSSISTCKCLAGTKMDGRPRSCHPSVMCTARSRDVWH
jgi:hypothetical protein